MAVGAMRAIEFVADAPGDWAFHCHKTHHTMNAMGHDLPNFIGVQRSAISRRPCASSCRAYMPMGSTGMAEMGSMEMPMPDNTLPMMTGFGQFGPIEMGGMFTMMKVREGLGADDYSDPGPYKNPPGTVAYKFKGDHERARAAIREPRHAKRVGNARLGRKPLSNRGARTHSLLTIRERRTA